MLGSKKKEEAFPVNEALLNVITPMGLEIKRNSLVIGENLGKVYGAVRYPQKVDMGWLSKITNIPSTIVSVGITPIDNGSLISAISKSIVQQRGAADSAKDPLTRQRAEKAAEDGEKIMQRIDQEGETVAMMSLTVMPIAQDEVNFTKVCRRVESAFNIQKCKVRTLANLQKEGFQSISPTYPANSTVDSIVSRIIPMSTFVGGFPFASSGYNDGRGYYFAKDSNGGLVILDTWERGNDRTNSSFVIMGVAGIGKSTVVKHIMLSEYMKGTKILCIDPESEYKDMCRNLNGSWLNAGGGKNGRSNLLQIRPAPRDDDDETDKLYTDEGNGMSDMALHMKTLEIEFSLYLPSLTDMQKAILKQTIIELYNQFGIFWETDIRQLKATDFPILSDLHALLEKKAEANKENPVYEDVNGEVQRLLSIGVVNLVTGETMEDALDELTEALSEDGMQRYVVKAPVYEQPATQREKAPEPDEIIPYRWNARNIRIAVAGSQRRSGVTVTAFNLASWLAARGAEVAYIEVNQNRHLQLLLNIYEAAPDGEHYTIDGIDCYLTNEPDKAYQFIIYDCGVMQTPTSIFRDADHRLLCGSVLPYEIPVFHKALSECGSLEVRPVAICVPQEIQEYCMELFGENVQIAAASHDLFAKRVNGQIYRPLVEKYIAGEKRL